MKNTLTIGVSMIWQAENERLLEKARLTGTEIRSLADWNSRGKRVRKGEKCKTVSVQSGERHCGIDPITGEDRYEEYWKAAYGFVAGQVG